MNLEDNELVLMCRTKDGQQRCVPISKLEAFQKSEEKRLSNSYTEEDLKKIKKVQQKLLDGINKKK